MVEGTYCVGLELTKGRGREEVEFVGERSSDEIFTTIWQNAK